MSSPTGRKRSGHFDLPALEMDGSKPLKLYIKSIATITAKTGVEMEALAAILRGRLTVYDMCKAIDKTMLIGGIRLLEKRRN